MAFDSIPSDLVLKMFHRLPFKDRVRLRGVNRLFNGVSIRSINFMRSLDINDDLVNYTQMIQPFQSLLESCSPILESIKATNRSSSMELLSALGDFVYPKLERLEMTVTNNEITKKLISRNRNLRSIILHLDREFAWPEDIVLENLETLEIHSSKEANGDSYIHLSPTLRPLIGMVPNLERLVIDREFKMAPFILSVQEFNQLLAAVPCLKLLRLELYHNSISDLVDTMCLDFEAAFSTWHLPKLSYLFILLNCRIPPSVLQHFSNSSPQLKVFAIGVVVEEIDDQSLTALSKLKRLRVLFLPGLEMTNDMFSKMITLLPSIRNLHIEKINREGLLSLPQHQHLREFSVTGMEMTKAEIIDVITKFPSLSRLGIKAISDARSPNAFNEFVTSTAALFHRNLKIRPTSMPIDGNESENWTRLMQFWRKLGEWWSSGQAGWPRCSQES